MIEHTDSIKNLMASLRKVQAELGGIVKDSNNPFHKSKYASLEAVIDTIKRPMHEAGLVFTQAPGAIVNGAVEVTTMVFHDSGEWMRSTLHVPLSKVDPQGVGSAITYGLRYALMATFGLPSIDDDAEASVGRGNGHTAKAPVVGAGTYVNPKATRPVPPPPADMPTSQTVSEDCIRAIRAAKSANDLDAWNILESTKAARARLAPAHFQIVKDEFLKQHTALKKAELLGA